MTESELYHHGIQGMKWGVRNGPPYPLNPSVSKRVKKSASEDNKGRQTKTSSDRVGLAAETAIYLAAYVAVPLAMVEAFKIKKSRDLEKRKKNRQFSTVDDVPKIKGKSSPEQNMRVTNPGFPGPGRTMNCMICTTAMAMREKGYDVQAGRDNDGFPDKMMEKCWNVGKATKIPKLKTKESLKSELNKLGDGAYGNLIISWRAGGGHSLFFKVENGKTRIYDGQSGEEVKIDDSLFRAIDKRKARYHRLDNAEPTEYALGVVERRKGV